MKWIHSFRARLILTMFPVVAGITIATLVLAEWKFMESYRRLFEEQFDSQISSYSSGKKKRTEALSKVLDKLAREQELITAISKKDLSDASRLLRAELEHLTSDRILSDIPGAGMGRPGNLPPPNLPGRPNGSEKEKDKDARERLKDNLLSRLPLSQLPYIALIDPEGNFLLSPKKNSPGGRDSLPPGRDILPPTLPAALPRETSTSAEFRRKSGKLQWLGDRKLADVLKEQEIGYLRVEFGEDNRNEQVREVYITPVRDPKSGQFLGRV
ncbi:hypothetical protein [Prosthecobacter vanneervenii]|uniref:Uncharacterized protein n=1 Tax=Prosthecobacter vanneervenii TaxID=48466 RepID=A0A7W8DJG5_9BACT|nr:hypothetical protein [Prosthecobacter vanneervenii]MBB5032057.1 hypothetical protein [Prosthecobacter vanneervenii]